MINYTIINVIGFYLIIYCLYNLFEKKEIKKEYILFFLIVSFSLFYGLRNTNVGVDTKEYISRYDLGYFTKDILFYFFTRLLNIVFNGNETLYLLFITFISNCLLGLSIKNFCANSNLNYNKIYYFTLLFPYVILSNINIIRQGLAISLSLFIISLMYSNNFNVYIKPKYYKAVLVIMVVFTCLIHKMFVFFWVFYLCILKKQNIKQILIFSVFLLILFKLPIIQYFLMFFKNNFYIEKLILHFTDFSLTNLLKILFYFCNYYLYFQINKNYLNDKLQPNRLEYYLNAYLLTLIICGSLFSMSNLYSERFLILADFIIPLTYFQYFNNLESPKSFFGIKKLFIDEKRFCLICFLYFFFSLFVILKTDLLLGRLL